MWIYIKQVLIQHSMNRYLVSQKLHAHLQFSKYTVEQSKNGIFHFCMYPLYAQHRTRSFAKKKMKEGVK